MVFPKERVAGALFFVAVTQFILGLTIVEALHPIYSVSANYASDLGIEPFSTVFNSSVFLLGLLLLIGTYFLKNISELKTGKKALRYSQPTPTTLSVGYNTSTGTCQYIAKAPQHSIHNKKDLDLLISTASKRMATFLQGLKVTFADPGEILRLEWVDLKDNI